MSSNFRYYYNIVNPHLDVVQYFPKPWTSGLHFTKKIKSLLTINLLVTLIKPKQD